jgi:hypothetical protein
MSKDEFDFTNEIDKASWELLKTHHERGAVFVIDKTLDLATVAFAIAKDNVNLVKIWLDNQQMQKLSEDLAENWKANPQENIVKFIIVQPYVLVQTL